MSIIMGIDPGSISTGYGIIERNKDNLKCISYGTIRPGNGLEHPDKLLHIYNGLVNVMENHMPQEMAIEEIFTAKNVKSAIKLGQARGVAIMAAASKGIKVYEYAALRVKQALVGYGGATKEQIRFMVKKIFGIDDKIDLNASDALAIAICHANTNQSVLKLPR